MGTITKKIPNGKMLSVHADRENSLLKIKITGDFFLFPEEKILTLEEEINKLRFDIEYDLLEKKITQIINNNKIQIIGFSASDLSKIIKEAEK